MLDVLLAQRAEFHRFLAARMGSDADAEDLLQQGLLWVLRTDASLRRGERAVPWFCRILHAAIVEHRRRRAAAPHLDQSAIELRESGADRFEPPLDWETAARACFRGILPSLRPRYAELIRRVDLRSEDKVIVAREMKISRSTLDVVLHRARSALRRRLEVLCSAHNRESSLTLVGKSRKRRSAQKA